MDNNRLFLQMTVDIVASHASMNKLGQAELLEEIELVHKKLVSLAGGIDSDYEECNKPFALQAQQSVKPALPKEAAFGKEKVFCMVCGKGMKTLKRHIATAHDLKPGQYRKMFDIVPGTALVAKDYSDARKKMAKDLNLAAQLEVARAAKGKPKKKA